MPAPTTIPRPGRSPADENLAAQVALLRAMTDLPPQDAIGAALSFLLHSTYHHPEMLRRVLNEPVVREGFTGKSMLAVLTRAAQ